MRPSPSVPGWHDLVAGARAVLLDFDGPMAALMPPPLNGEVAERVRRAAGVDWPDGLAATADHIALLRHLLDRPEALARAEAEASAAEAECAETCRPAPWLAELVPVIRTRELPWAVVTNNGAAAVRAFLRRTDLPAPAAIAARTPPTVHLLKPRPHLLLQALVTLGVPPAAAVFVGDSVTDVEAGRAAGVPVLGYAKDPARGRALLLAGACSVHDVHAGAPGDHKLQTD